MNVDYKRVIVRLMITAAIASMTGCAGVMDVEIAPYKTKVYETAGAKETIVNGVGVSCHLAPTRSHIYDTDGPYRPRVTFDAKGQTHSIFVGVKKIEVFSNKRIIRILEFPGSEHKIAYKYQKHCRPDGVTLISLSRGALIFGFGEIIKFPNDRPGRAVRIRVTVIVRNRGHVETRDLEFTLRAKVSGGILRFYPMT